MDLSIYLQDGSLGVDEFEKAVDRTEKAKTEFVEGAREVLESSL